MSNLRERLRKQGEKQQKIKDIAILVLSISFFVINIALTCYQIYMLQSP